MCRFVGVGRENSKSLGVKLLMLMLVFYFKGSSTRMLGFFSDL